MKQTKIGAAISSTPNLTSGVLPLNTAIAELTEAQGPVEFYALKQTHVAQMDPSTIGTYEKLAAQIETARSFINPEPTALLKKGIDTLAVKYNTLDAIDRKQALTQLSSLSKSLGIAMTVSELNKTVQAKTNEMLAHAETTATKTAAAPKFIKISHKHYAEYVSQNLLTKYLPELKLYITYSPALQKWTYSNDGKAFTDKLHSTIEQQIAQAAALPPCQHRDNTLIDLERTEAASFVRDVVAYSKTLPGFSIRIDQLNNKKHLLNCKNGTFNLDTYAFEESNPENLLTQVTNTRFDPSATCHEWEATLLDIHSGDVNTVKYLQAYLGYSLLANPIEKTMLIMHGSQGNNGKSLITGTMLQLLGDYGVSARPSIICTPIGSSEHANTGHNTEIMKLADKRLINFNEGTGMFKTQMLKQMVGDLGAGISAREINGRETTLHLVGNILLDTNGVPTIPANDEATWRRIQVIPYKKYYIKSTDTLEVQTAQLKKGNKFEDTSLASKLQSEYAGILNWLIEGIKLYRANGLIPTREMVEAKARLRVDRDPLQQWLGTNLKDCAKADAIPRKVLWDSWQAYEATQHTQVFKNSATFYAAIEQKGVEIAKYNGDWVIKEKALRTKPEVEAYLAAAKTKASQADQLALNI